MRVLYLSLGSLNGQDNQDGHHSHNGQGSQCGHGGQSGQGNDLGIWSILSLAVPILQFLNTVHKTVDPPPFFTRPESNHCLLLSSTIMILDEEVEKVRYLIRGSPFLTQQPAPRPSFLPFSTNLFCHKVGLAPLSRREVEGEKWNLFIFQSLLQIDATLDYCQKLIDRSRYLVSRFWPHFHHPSSFYLCRQHLRDGRRKFQLDSLHSQRWGFIVVFTPLRPLFSPA